MMGKPQRRVVIVGASAAGLRCGARLARLEPDTEIVAVERRREFSIAACGIPYMVSGDLESADILRQSPDGTLRDEEYFESVKGIRVLSGWGASSIDVAAREITIENGAGTRTLAWDDLVLATGSRAARLPGQPEHPRVVNIHYLGEGSKLRRSLERGELGRALIVGAGLVGCEMAEAFRAMWGLEVAVLERESHPLPELLDAEGGALVARALIRQGIDLETGIGVEAIRPEGESVRVETSEGARVADVVVVAVGVEPEVELARAAGVRIGATGAIQVDDRLGTSIPGIWAVGDCVEIRHAVTGKAVHLPLGSLANREGRTLANILAGRRDRFPAVSGAGAVKVFDWSVAATGCTMHTLRMEGRSAESVWVCAHDRAHYWPEAKEIFLQLVYDPDSGRLLGLQALGEGEVAKRVDAATQFLARRATVADLSGMEHSYSPPYAPAMEPLAVAALVAENQRSGIRSVSPLAPLDGVQVLDVRLSAERARRPFPHAKVTGLALEELRLRVAELEPVRWVAICERGGRSAEAVRILRRHGLDATYLGGGYRWRESAAGEQLP
jgi:NADPH-dependent 2,4-dienoyl-CoA reductase/sulfur reductase-like enzyme/rhodanese-related sulfurtransferase